MCVYTSRRRREGWREGGLQADGTAAAESSMVEIPENLTHPSLGRDGEMSHGNTPSILPLVLLVSSSA